MGVWFVMNVSRQRQVVGFDDEISHPSNAIQVTSHVSMHSVYGVFVFVGSLSVKESCLHALQRNNIRKGRTKSSNFHPLVSLPWSIITWLEYIAGRLNLIVVLSIARGQLRGSLPRSSLPGGHRDALGASRQSN